MRVPLKSGGRNWRQDAALYGRRDARRYKKGRSGPAIAIEGDGCVAGAGSAMPCA